MTHKQIDSMFTYHQPFGNQPERYQEIRDNAKWLAIRIEQLCPDSAERSAAFLYLQQSVMWANASIAINEKEEGNENNQRISSGGGDPAGQHNS